MTGQAVLAFDNGGISGIVWRNSSTDENLIWSVQQAHWYHFIPNGPQLTNTMTNVITAFGSTNWQIVATADFDRDGQGDLLSRNPTTGENAIWLRSDTASPSRQPIQAGDPSYYVVGTGDFNHDGYPDILWRHRFVDQTYVWYMFGTNAGPAVRITSPADPSWRAAAVGDFNHDGNADILWQNASAQQLAIWYMDGLVLTNAVILSAYPGGSWNAVGTGHFNSVGAVDILFRNFASSGENAVWWMRNSTLLAGTHLPDQPYPAWSMGGTVGYSNAMTLSATASTSPATLTLNWRFGDIPPPRIERRVFGSRNWTTLATNCIPTHYSSTDLIVGQRYEYLVGEDNYLLTAIAATPDSLEDQGKVILVVANNVTNFLAQDLATLHTNLVGDGWTVIRTNVPPHDDATWANNTNQIAVIKEFLQKTYEADPAGTKAVFLIGHIPIPYSGCYNPDGHGVRALPADGYYVDFAGKYTDLSSGVDICCSTNDLFFPEPRNRNLPSDGKWDQNTFTGQVKLAFGRVDFAKLPCLALQGETDLQTQQRLLRQYLNKDDRYRRKLINLTNRVVVGNFFEQSNFVAYYPKLFREALKNGSRVVGYAPEALVQGDCLQPESPCLWGIHGGFGQPSQVQGTNYSVHQSSDFANALMEPKTGFLSLWGSYLDDFDYTNSFMRAFLGNPNYGLGASWFVPESFPQNPRGTLSFEQLGLGATIGSAVQRSINNTDGYDLFEALMGDPTLRWQILAPPSGLMATNHGPDVVLNWSHSVETTNYFVYRSTNGIDGPWTKLNPDAWSGNTYTNSLAPSGTKVYQVRALKLISTGSGSYTNLSQAAFVTIN